MHYFGANEGDPNAQFAVGTRHAAGGRNQHVLAQSARAFLSCIRFSSTTSCLSEYLPPILGVPVQEAMEKGTHTVRSLLTLLAAYTFQ